MKTSLTISSLVVLVLGLLSKGAGVPLLDGQIESFVTTGAQLLGVVGVYYGRYRAGGINLFGIKKSE